MVVLCVGVCAVVDQGGVRASRHDCGRRRGRTQCVVLEQGTGRVGVGDGHKALTLSGGWSLVHMPLEDQKGAKLTFKALENIHWM